MCVQLLLSVENTVLRCHACVVTVCCEQVFLVLWQTYDAQTHRMHYAPCSVWVAVVISVHTAVAVVFSRHLHSLAAAERSKLKRDFYFHFTLVNHSSLLLE